MSRLFYFASDMPLAEQQNPHLEFLSINQALEKGIELNMSILGGVADYNKPGVIIYCEDENMFSYPNIYRIDKNTFYDDIGTKEEFCTALEWDGNEKTIPVILNYIQSQMQTSSKLEMWSVWLGSKLPIDLSDSCRREHCTLADLSISKLQDFYASNIDYYCITIVH